jgi:hypothetical protein
LTTEGTTLTKEISMTFKSFISPLAVAAVLALGSALPASAAIFGGNVTIQYTPSRMIDQSSLTPAQRTLLEDQCRQRQSDSFDEFDSRNDGEFAATTLRANAAYCASIGLPS